MKLSIAAIILITFTSCGRYYYYPTYQNQVKTKTKGDIQATNFYGSGNQGVNINYAVSDNLGIGATVNKITSNASMNDIYLYGYKNFKKDTTQKCKQNLTLALSLAMGNGKLLDDQVDLKMKRIFFQPSVYYASKYFDAGVSLRYTFANYNAHYINNGGPSDYPTPVETLSGKTFKFLEYQISAAIGLENIKIQACLSNATLDDKKSIDFIDNELYFGLIYRGNINNLFKKIFKK